MKTSCFKILEKFYHFGTLSGNPLLSCWISSARLSDPHSGVPATFRGKIFSAIYHFFSSFLLFEWFFFTLTNLFRHRFQNSGLHVTRSFQGERNNARKKFNSLIVSRFQLKTFELLATTVRQRCQNCSFCAKRTNWRKQCFEKLFNTLTKIGIQITLFRTFRGKFWQFCRICNQCARGTFWRKTFVLEKN